MAWKHVVLLLVLVISLSACKRGGSPRIDDPAPVVTLQDFAGKAVDLPQDLKGKVWLVRFWSLDCGFCDKEVLLGLEQLYQKYKERGFVPVAVNVSKIDPADERLQRFKQLTYPMLVDERGLVAKKFGVIGLPTSFVIDSEGVIKEKITGEAGLAEFEKLFTTLIK